MPQVYKVVKYTCQTICWDHMSAVHPNTNILLDIFLNPTIFAVTTWMSLLRVCLRPPQSIRLYNLFLCSFYFSTHPVASFGINFGFSTSFPSGTRITLIFPAVNWDGQLFVLPFSPFILVFEVVGMLVIAIFFLDFYHSWDCYFGNFCDCDTHFSDVT